MSARLALMLVCAIALVFSEGAYADNSLCQRYPHLRICSLHSNVDLAIGEMSFLVGAAEQPQMFVARPSDEALLENNMQKRKSAFVRFGKRSATIEAEPAANDDSSAEGLLINPRQTRKSTYVRFG